MSFRRWAVPSTQQSLVGQLRGKKKKKSQTKPAYLVYYKAEGC